jgi:hypothetical protein
VQTLGPRRPLSQASGVESNLISQPLYENGHHALRIFYESHSLYLLQQFSRLTQQRLNPLRSAIASLVNRSCRRAFWFPLGAPAPLCTAVHAAAPFAAYRRRTARSAGADCCATTRACQLGPVFLMWSLMPGLSAWRSRDRAAVPPSELR